LFDAAGIFIYENLSFDELTEIASVRIHSALLDGGGKAMKAEVHLWMSQAIVWNRMKDIESTPIKLKKQRSKNHETKT